MTIQSAIDRAGRYLAQTQDAAGGWGYHQAQAAFVEPTALALLALSGYAEWAAARAAGAAWLIENQLADGSWGVNPTDPEGCWATAWAIWALAEAPGPAAEVLARGIDWWRGWQPWVGEPGQERDPALWIDPTVAGWPWNPGGTSWVEPTALGIIALCVTGHAQDPRVTESLQYLRDRACAGGGWNVGNPYMLGQNIPAAVSPTTLALLALRQAHAPDTDTLASEGLAVLAGLVQQAATPANLAWGLWGLRAHDQPGPQPALDRLGAQQDTDGGWRYSPHLTALALLALRDREPEP